MYSAVLLRTSQDLYKFIREVSEAKFDPKVGIQRTTKIKNLVVLVIILVVPISLPYYMYVVLVLILLFLLVKER